MAATTLRLGPADREALFAGAETLGVDLEPADLDRFAEFAGLLDTWRVKTNLISCRDSRELVERHLLDSLALARHLDPRGGIVDLGSGAGFPGVPLAVARAGGPVLLVEARRRRANFLRAVKRQLGLNHVAVLEQRAESLSPDSSVKRQKEIRNVVSRAVWPDGEIFGIAARWVGVGGRLLWMRTEVSGSDDPGEEFERVGVEEYRVGSAGPRAIHVFERR